MTFNPELAQTPTAIGDITITLRSDAREPVSQLITFEALDVYQDLAVNNVDTGSLVVTDNPSTTPGQIVTYVEGSDYEVNYVNSQIRIVTGSAMVTGTAYRLSYTYLRKYARFDLEIYDQDGVVMARRSGDLQPHLTAGESTNLQSFMDNLRTRAETQIIGP
jgi:hypothetical protein